MKCDDDTFYMKPNERGMTGDPFIVNAFLDSFQRPAQHWPAAMQMRSGTSLLRGELPDDDEADLSHCSYAVDLHRALLLAVGCGTREVQAQLQKADDVLGAALAMAGMRQNRDKR
eukprot:1777540-Pyramimonas_sp.AAC.1